MSNTSVTVNLFGGPGDSVDINLLASAAALVGSSSLAPGNAIIQNASVSVFGGSGNDTANITFDAFGTTQSHLTNNNVTLQGGAGSDTFDLSFQGGTVKSNNISFDGGQGADHLTIHITATSLTATAATNNTLTMSYNSTADFGDTLTVSGTAAPNLALAFNTASFGTTAVTHVFAGGTGVDTGTHFGVYAGAVWYDADGFNTGATAQQVVAITGAVTATTAVHAANISLV